MKKAIAVLCTLALCAGLCACGKTPSASSSAASKSAGAPAASSSAASSASASSAAPSKAASAGASASSSAAQSAAGTAARLGRWDGDTYVNEWANIKFTLPKGWRALSAQEIAKVVGAGTDIIAGDTGTDKNNLSAQTSKTDTYAFYVTSADGNGYFFMDIFDRAAGNVPKMTPAEYAQQMETMLNSLTTLSAQVVEVNTDDDFCGMKGTTMSVMLSPANNPSAVAKQAYFIAEKDKYLLNFMIGGNTDAGVEAAGALLGSCTSAK